MNNDEDNQGTFYEGSVGYSNVTSAGIVGVNYRQVGFGIDDTAGNPQLDGIFREAGLEWSLSRPRAPLAGA